MESCLFVLHKQSFPPTSLKTYPSIYLPLHCSKLRKLHFPIQSLINPSAHLYRSSVHSVPKVLSKNNKHLTKKKTPQPLHIQGLLQSCSSREKEKTCKREGLQRTKQDRFKTGQKKGERTPVSRNLTDLRHKFPTLKAGNHFYSPSFSNKG